MKVKHENERLRVNVFLPDDFSKEFKNTAAKSGMSLTALGSICIQLGYSALQMSSNKEFQPYFESAIKELQENEITKK
jgi:hypothetical protein